MRIEAIEAKLTERHLEIFDLLGQASPIKKIAARLFLSPKTIETHVQNMRDRLGVSRLELDRLAAVYAHVKKNGGGPEL